MSVRYMAAGDGSCGTSRSILSVRRSLNVAVGVSLSLCVVMLSLWVRSCWKCDYLTLYRNPQRSYVLFSRNGFINLVRADEPYGFNPSTGGYGTVYAPYESSLLPLNLPHAFAVLAFGVLPACWFAVRLERRRKRRLGLCRVCGYDLRAGHDRCPECGAVVSRGETAAI